LFEHCYFLPGCKTEIKVDLTKYSQTGPEKFSSILSINIESYIALHRVKREREKKRERERERERDAI